MRFRLRTILIVLVAVCCTVIANYCAYRYAYRVTELALDVVVVRLGSKMYPWLVPHGLE